MDWRNLRRMSVVAAVLAVSVMAWSSRTASAQDQPAGAGQQSADAVGGAENANVGESAANSPVDASGALEESMQRLSVWVRAVFYSLILVLIVAFISLIFLRFSRRYRERLTAKRQPPTEVPDVWSMHKVPQEQAETQEADDTEPDSDGDGGDDDDADSPEGGDRPDER